MLSRFEQFSFAISSIYGCIQKIERDEMVRYGLKGAYAQYLVIMNRCPDGLTASELCDICDRDKAAVSRAVSEMEQKGLVVREASNDTLYRARIKLTDVGKEAAQFVSERGQLAVDIAGSGLTDENRQVLYAALDLISSNLQTICSEGLPTK